LLFLNRKPVRPLPDLLGEALRNRPIWLELYSGREYGNQFERFTHALKPRLVWWEPFRTVAWQAI